VKENPQGRRALGHSTNQEREMGKHYVENTGSSPLWVAGVLIAPGEGREVFVPDEAPAPVEVEQVDAHEAALQELLAGNVAVVTAALDGLGADTLVRLREMESAAAKPRKGVLEAIDVACIAVADAALNLQSDTL